MRKRVQLLSPYNLAVPRPGLAIISGPRSSTAAMVRKMIDKFCGGAMLVTDLRPAEPAPGSSETEWPCTRQIASAEESASVLMGVKFVVADGLEGLGLGQVDLRELVDRLGVIAIGTSTSHETRRLADVQVHVAGDLWRVIRSSVGGKLVGKI